MSSRAIRGPLRYDTIKIVLSGDYVVVNESLVIVNKTSGAATQITLPPSIASGGRREVKVIDAKGDALTNNITVVPDGTDTINDGASLVMAANFQSATFLDDGTGNWVIDQDTLDGGNQGAIKGTSIAIGPNGSEVNLNSTPAEIDAVCDVSTRLVDVTSASLTITAASHAGKTVLLDSSHTQTITLPAASGSSNDYTFLVKTLGTDGSKIIQVANTTDVIAGASYAANTQNTIDTFITSATSDTVTMNNTTQGGGIGTQVTIKDIASGTFRVKVENITTGNPATPFSASV